MRLYFILDNRVELLSPAGDFNCVKAAVQNGADAVYLGFSSFSARSSATNFLLMSLRLQFSIVTFVMLRFILLLIF